MCTMYPIDSLIPSHSGDGGYSNVLEWGGICPWVMDYCARLLFNIGDTAVAASLQLSTHWHRNQLFRLHVEQLDTAIAIQMF